MEKIKNFFLKNKNDKQIIIKNSFWLFLGEIGVRFIKLFIFVYAARKLGTDQLGLFSYSIAIMSTFSIISDIGINSVLIKKISEKENKDVYISTGFILKIILSISAGLLFLSTIFLLKSNDLIKNLIPIMSLVLFFDSMREFGFTLNRAFEKMEVEAITKIITTAILLLISIVLISYYGTALSLAYSYLISAISGTIFMYFTFRLYLKNSLKNFKKELIMTIFKESWPLAIVSVFGIIMTNIDTIILGLYKNVTDVAIYSVAQKPLQIIYIIPSLIGISVLPIISRVNKENKERVSYLINKIIKIILIFSITTVSISLLWGGKIITILFSNQYHESILVFKIMIIALLLSAPGIIFSNLLFIQNQQKKIARSIMIGAVSNIILCLILIPRFGVYGAAISTTISQIISNSLIIIKAIKQKD